MGQNMLSGMKAMLKEFVNGDVPGEEKPLIPVRTDEMSKGKIMPRKAWQKRKKRLQMQRASRVANRYQK